MTKRPPRGWPVSWMCATTSWRNSNPTRKKRDIFKTLLFKNILHRVQRRLERL